MDEHDELAHWQQLRIDKVKLVADLERTAANPDKLDEYISEYGEFEGSRRYKWWRISVNERRDAEIHALNEIKITIDLLRKAQEEVQLLTVVFFELAHFPDLSKLQHRIWKFLAKKHNIYLKQEGQEDDVSPS